MLRSDRSLLVGLGLVLLVFAAGAGGEPPPLDEGLPPAAASGMGELIATFVKTMLVLSGVLALVYLTLHKGLGKLVARAQVGKRLRVVERVGLDPRRALYLVEVDGKELLLGASEGGIARLLDLGQAEGAAGAEAKNGQAAKGEVSFARVLEETEAGSVPVTEGLRPKSGAREGGEEA